VNPPQPSVTPAMSRRTGHALLIVTVLVVAANLRPTITAYGSVVGMIESDTGLSSSALGVLGAIPLFAFALVSPVVHLLTRRIGPDRAVLLAIIVLIVGTVIRSLPGSTASLWVGTAILGAAIAVGNVVIPSIIKRDFPTEVPVMTGLYSALLGGTAAFASGLTLPIALRAGWRIGIGVWGVLSVLALVAWLIRLRLASGLRRAPELETRPAGHHMWTSAVAWQVTLFMGTQATGFYLLVTWLPTIEVSFGRDPVTAGWHSFIYQVVGIFAGLAITVLMRGRRDHRLVGMGISLLLIVAIGGLLLAPSWSVLWLALAGSSGGSSLVIALALVGERARTSADAGRLSGMAQSVGYLLAAAGPIGAGLLFDATGSWTTPLVAVIVIGVLQLVVALFAGQDRFTHDAHATWSASRRRSA
jgi:CP family cyanate transporter-like MFS transporter